MKNDESKINNDNGEAVMQPDNQNASSPEGLTERQTDDADNGKSLKTVFTEYLNQKKTSNPRDKTEKLFEFTQPLSDEEVMAHNDDSAESDAGPDKTPDNIIDIIKQDTVGGFTQVAEINKKKAAGGGGAISSNDDTKDTAVNGALNDLLPTVGGYLNNNSRHDEGGYNGDDGVYPDGGFPDGVGYREGGYRGDDGYRDESAGYSDDDGYPDDNGYPNSAGYSDDDGYPDDSGYPNGAGYSNDMDYPGEDVYREGGYPDDIDYPGGGYSDEDGSPRGRFSFRGYTPKEIAARSGKAILIAIKWVLIYMGRFIATVFKTSVIIILVVLFGLLGAGIGAIYGYLQNIEPITNIMLEMKIQTSYIYDADGNQIARLTGSQNINRQLVHYNDISPHLPKALIAIEDKRFESHNGVDPRRIMGAGMQFVLGGSDAHGASTITQQLVKNVTGKKDETLERKVQEWYLAIELEKTMEKWKILELYLNVVYFGNSCYGVSSASRTYFGKSAGDLSLAESAFLIGITNSPGLYNPYTENGLNNAKRRQATILNEMLNQGMISDEEHDEARAEKLVIIPKAVTAAVSSRPNSYFVDYVIEEVKNDLMAEKGMTAEMALAQIYNYGLRIHTTQNPGIQSALDSVFNDPQYFPPDNPDAQNNNETPQGAMVILDPNNAKIIAIAGGYGEKLADRTFNRATQARRQPGSSIKPIAVYGPALDQYAITLASVVDDAPTHLDPNEPERIYPGNSTNDFRGLTTVRNALRRSVNVVAVKTWLRIPDTSRSYLSKAGINRDNEKQIALALGGLHRGVTPLEMAAAYVPFVNRGMYYEPASYTKVLDSSGRVLLDKTVRKATIVYSEQTAYLMTSVLEDVIKTGTGTGAALFDGMMPAAGKTGTTNDNADRWFVGYTPYYVASTWYGYDNRIKKITLTQEELGNAVAIWQVVMEKIHYGLEPKEFLMPDQIVQAGVCAYSGNAPTELCREDRRGSAVRNELFARGTEPRELCGVHVATDICKAGSEATGGQVTANRYCPPDERERVISTRRELPYNPEPGDPYPTDWAYEYKQAPDCPYHTEDGIAPEFSPEPDDEPDGDAPDDTDGPGGDVIGVPGTNTNGGAQGAGGGQDIGQGETAAESQPAGGASARPLRTPRPARVPITPAPTDTEPEEG